MSDGITKALDLDLFAMRRHDTQLIDGVYVDLAKQRFYEKFTVVDQGHRLWYYRLLEALGYFLMGDQNEVLRKAGSKVECGTCGLHVPYTWDADALSFTIAEEDACPFPGGHIPLTFDLEIPSGVLVVENDMRRLLGEDQPPEDTLEGWSDLSKNYYVNTDWGTAHTSMWYADRGMAHCFVGNTCPGMYRLSEDHLQIGSFWEFDGPEDYNGTDTAPGERVAGITTDLWWYSIMDKDRYEALAGEPVEADNYTELVKVKPGRWTFTHHWHEGDFDRDKAKVYTDIRYKG